MVLSKRSRGLSAKFVPKTKNVKLGNVSATYLSIKSSCPKTCKWKDNVCYAQTGYVGMINNYLDGTAKGKKAEQIVREEARLVRQAKPSGRALRLHVAGDVRNKRSIQLLEKASRSWLKNGGDKVWTYTHFWKHPRRNWGPISVLASVDDHKDIGKAWQKGFASAIIVPTFPNGDKAFYVNGWKFVACPQQTRGVKCDQCRLCLNDRKLYKQKTGIAFQIHGSRKNKFSLKVVK